jgi:hypothetical protein
MAQLAHMICAFSDEALSVADRLGDMARNYGLVAWTSSRGDGDWQIRLEGEDALLQKFAVEVGLDQISRDMQRPARFDP